MLYYTFSTMDDQTIPLYIVTNNNPNDVDVPLYATNYNNPNLTNNNMYYYSTPNEQNVDLMFDDQIPINYYYPNNEQITNVVVPEYTNQNVINNNNTFDDEIGIIDKIKKPRVQFYCALALFFLAFTIVSIVFGVTKK